VTRVKVCGITRLPDALAAVEWGADALGFVFYPGSPRFITPTRARGIIRALPPFVATVGVFVDSPLAEILSVVETCGLTAVQLHGTESTALCRRIPVGVIKAFRVKGARLPVGLGSCDADAILLDAFRKEAPGGTGVSFPWQVALEARRYGRIILAGGLNARNVTRAIAAARPYAVDVSSGVEQEPGKKDPVLLKQFLERVKRYRAEP
jgi:phosphoribosylanthranilate isomerase